MGQNTSGKRVSFSDYGTLEEIKTINTSILCELAILKRLAESFMECIDQSILKKYDENVHHDLWSKVVKCLQKNHSGSEFFENFYQFMTQFSPGENFYTKESVNHLDHYITIAIDINNSLARRGNIIELGGNHGLLSKVLQLFGNDILCTDLHHGIISDSINSYRTGTWIREHIMGITAVDTFEFNKDNLKNLEIFEKGIDAIVMRGTGILVIPKYKNRIVKILSKMKSRVENKLKIECLTSFGKMKRILKNINGLLSILNDEGIIYAKNENLFYEYSLEKRSKYLDMLVRYAYKKNIAITYVIEKDRYINPGWEKFNITIKCKKIKPL